MEYLILQVEDKRLIAARFELSRRSARLIGAVGFELDAEHSLAEAAGQIAAGTNGAPRVILCLPPGLFGQRLVTLPFNDLRKVREVLPAQLQGEIPLPVEELLLDALPVKAGQFLALWARQPDISQALSEFRQAGIEPHLISCATFAWGRLPGVPLDCAVCDGRALAVLTGGQLMYFRALDAGATPATVSATLSALEISGTPLPARLCLLGDGAWSAEENAAFTLPVEQLEPPPEAGQLFKNAETFGQLAGLFAVAQACQDGSLPDFRQGELAWTAGDIRLRKQLLLTGVLVLVIVLVLFTTQILQYRAASADIASLDRSIAAIYREIFPNRTKAVDEVAETRAEIKKLTVGDGNSRYLDLLKRLADAKGATINGLYEAELEGGTVRLKGDARSSQAVNDFKTSLSGVLATAQLGEVKSRPDGSVTFSLSGTLKEAQP